MKTLGERIRELRGERDSSLRELAQKLEVSPAFLSDVELGRRYPSEKVLIKMAKSLGVTVDDLRTHDTRAPLEDLKRITINNPTFAVALRKMVDTNLSAKQLESLIQKISDKEKKR